jgi:hypothetical protein
MNDLIFTDGQEGFVGLEILTEAQIKRDDFVVLDMGNKSVKFGNLPKLKKRLTVLSITKRTICQCLYDLNNEYDLKIQELMLKKNKCSKRAISDYYQYKVREYDKHIQMLMRLKETTCQNIPQQLIDTLLTYCPTKYWRYEYEGFEMGEEKIEFDRQFYGGKVVLTVLKIDQKAICYLEQKFDLMAQDERDKLDVRINTIYGRRHNSTTITEKYSFEQIKNLILAFKETLKTNDGQDFDTYMDNYVKKTLASVEGGF